MLKSAEEVIKQLKLELHPEKGYFRQVLTERYPKDIANGLISWQTFEDTDRVDGRSRSTCIYYLLEKDVVSHWHRVTDAVEIWHYYAGAPLQLSLSWDDGKPVRKEVLGPDVFNDQHPQVIVEKNEWQRAQSLGDWTLVGCTVAPGFIPDVFVMAEPGWEPKES